MKAAVWRGSKQLEMEEVHRPAPGQAEVLVAVRAAGICGSELSGYLGHNSLRVPPLVMGHEFAGEVVQIGEGVRSVREGDQVVVNPLLSCGQCALCRRGQENLCSKRSLIGAHRAGAFAELVAVPERACHLLPDGLTGVEGALAEPLACSLRAVRLAGVEAQSSVLVFGAGAIGLFALRAAQVAGAARIAVVDTNPDRLRIARDWGAVTTVNPRENDLTAAVRDLTDGAGADCGIDAVGLPVTRRQLVENLRPAGTAVLVGLHQSETTLDGNDIVRREIRITGSFAYTQAEFAEAITLLQSKALPVDESWLQERPLDQAKQAFEDLIDRPSHIAKIILKP